MTFTNTFLVVFLFVIIVFNVWNAINLYSLKKRPSKQTGIDDPKYWELKYKIQFLVASFSLILAVFAFLGYNTIDKIKEAISSGLEQKLDSTKNNITELIAKQSFIDNRMSEADTLLTKYQNIIIGLSNRQSGVNNSIQTSSTELNKLKGKISEINGKNILQQNIYIVDEILLDVSKVTSGDDWSKIIYFSNLKTISGDKIPPMNNPPFILAFSNENCDFRVSQVTRESFKLTLQTYTDTVKFARPTLFITIKP
mgnify:CR=1 FL=1